MDYLKPNIISEMKETDQMTYGLQWYGSQMKMIPTGYLEEILPTLTEKQQPLIDYIKKRLKKL